jgi:UDP-2-acetamido-2-deoxy-ribo-hexuluronate aminotransferase
MNVKFFNPGKEFELHEEEYTNAWKDVRRRGDLILRKDGEEFERRFAKFVGTKYAVGVSNGTDAIMLCVKYLKPKRVKVPYHTFKSTVSSVIHAGSKPVFKGKSDISIVAHIAGELSPIPKGIVIEDAAQGLGAVKNPKTFAQTWSFYPAKILGGPGDGGAITTNNKKFYEWLKEYRNHFKSTNKEWGGNYRLDNVVASELLIKLKRINKTLSRRKEIAKMYLVNLPKDILPEDSKIRSWQDFIIRTEHRDKLYNFLKKNGVETMKNEYPMPIRKSIGSIFYESMTLRLPINEVLTDEEILYVIEKIKELYGKS